MPFIIECLSGVWCSMYRARTVEMFCMSCTVIGRVTEQSMQGFCSVTWYNICVAIDVCTESSLLHGRMTWCREFCKMWTNLYCITCLICLSPFLTQIEIFESHCECHDHIHRVLCCCCCRVQACDKIISWLPSLLIYVAVRNPDSRYCNVHSKCTAGYCASALFSITGTGL